MKYLGIARLSCLVLFLALVALIVVAAQPKQEDGSDAAVGKQLNWVKRAETAREWEIFEENGKYGFKTKDGDVMIPAQFSGTDITNDFREGVTSAAMNGKWGYIGLDGEFSIAPRFDDASSFYEGLAVVGFGGKWGVIDHSGGWVIEPQGRMLVSGFRNGLAIVRENGKEGYIDRSGTVVIPVSLERAFGFSEGLAAAKKDGKWGYIDPKGRWVIPSKFDQAYSFHHGIAKVEINGTYEVVIDRSGRIVQELGWPEK